MKLRQIIFLASVLLLTSCATKVSSFKEDQDRHLEHKEGYLLFAVDTTYSLNELHLTGTKYIKLTADDLRAGSNYILVSLPEGQYSIDKIKFNRYLQIKDFEDGLWDFTVNEGMITYVGHLQIYTPSFWSSYSNVKLLNKSSIALEYMQTNFSNILDQRKITYAGPGEDSFFDVVSNIPTAQGGAK
ncbi:hypothetical protein QWY77_00760 [Thalassotalea ponticola]|uniref:hypothetical protein n=1 Tax=Thalassotalea ponticola TaxID=1523392 RepID=UPI0025B5E5ED|nr:hypothetical protein [Thalassotalea ponticola]MDN3651315.1 hypothetical protein [Thalassotalea ponticola]